MQKNDLLNVKIIDYDQQGYGVAKHDGYTIFVKFALVDEEILVKILKVQKTVAFAKIENIINNSYNRVVPICPYFYKCGGCDLMHANYEEQLNIKKRIIKLFLEKNKINYPEFDIISSPRIIKYRNKVSFPVGVKNNKACLGFYRSNTHELIQIDKCDICEDFNEKLIKVINDFLNKYSISIYDENLKFGLVKYVQARKVNETIMIIIVLNGDYLPHGDELIVELKKVFDNFTLEININKKHNNVILSNESKLLYGTASVNCCTFNIMHQISTLSFMQVNLDIQNKIYAYVALYFEKIIKNKQNSVLIDAYSGAGLLSAMMCKYFSKVYGLEIVPSATRNADELKQINNVDNLVNICGDCAMLLPQVIGSETNSSNDCYVLLDPPRKGVDQTVIDSLVMCQAKEIVYISCNPESLARDIAYLFSKTNNYAITNMQAFDMFPQTKHVETVVIISKIK